MKTVAAYLSIVVIYLAFYMSTQEKALWLIALGAAIATIAGSLIGRIKLPGLIATFSILTLVIPITLLYLIGVNAEIKSPLPEILKTYEWVSVGVPFLSALITFYVFSMATGRKT